MAVLHQLGRQAVPVMINEVVIRACYFIRRLTTEWKAKSSFMEVDWQAVLPWNSRTMTRMLTIATGTFCAVDLVDAAIRAGLKSGGNLPGFVINVVLRVNFVGIGRFAIAIYSDASMGSQREGVRDDRIALLSQQLQWGNAKVFYLQGASWRAAQDTEASLREVELMMRKMTGICTVAWTANRASLRQISHLQTRIHLNNPQLINDIRNSLNWD